MTPSPRRGSKRWTETTERQLDTVHFFCSFQWCGNTKSAASDRAKNCTGGGSRACGALESGPKCEVSGGEPTESSKADCDWFRCSTPSGLARPIRISGTCLLYPD
jgi:hypothetical protein